MRDKVGFDNLFGDIFGLNIRIISTIYTSFANPKALMLAAQEPFSEGKYTPSIRAWFSLFAITMLFQFLWIGPDTSMKETYLQSYNSLPDEFFTRLNTTRTAFAERAITLGLVLYPFCAVIFLGCGAFLTRMGKGVSLAQKARYAFMIQLPSMTIGVFTAVTFAKFIDFQDLSPAGIALMFVPILIPLTIDSITARRTVFANSSMAGLKSFAVAFWYFILGSFSSTFAHFLAGFYMGFSARV